MFAATARWRRYWPEPMRIGWRERGRILLGILLGIAATQWICGLLAGPGAVSPLLVASIGAAAILVFALPGSPLAQPWPVIGGHCVSAAIGSLCAWQISDPIIGAALACAGAAALMLALRCLHPPGGAIALAMVLGPRPGSGADWHFLVFPVLANAVLLVLVAIVYNRATRHAYPAALTSAPVNPHATGDRLPAARIGPTAADLEVALVQAGELVDISRDRLAALLKIAEKRAYQRRFGDIRCCDIMARDLVCVEFATELDEAWQLLRQHKIKVLPVIDRARRVIGIVSLVDFLKRADLQGYQSLHQRLRQFLCRTPGMYSEKPEVVGQIMVAPVFCVDESMHVVELVALLSDRGLHHVPVINAERRIVGMISQSDLIAALYRDAIDSA